MKRIVTFIGFAVLILVACKTSAQQGSLQSSLEKDTILIGDQIHLELSFEGPRQARVNWPFFQDSLSTEIEIIKKSGLDSSIRNENLQLKQSLLITSFDSGKHQIGPFRFQYQIPGDTTQFFSISKALQLNVLNIAVNTTKAIKPIKAPIDAPLTFGEIWPWLLVAFGVLLIIAAIWYYYYTKKRAKPLIPIRQKPKLPPHIQALNDLERLKQKKLWQAGKVKEYHSELTDIVRIYMEERFGIRALEMTSFEIIKALEEKDLETHILEKISTSFTLADMVKFAKEIPLPTDNDNSLANAKYFVEQTIQRQKEDQESEDKDLKAKKEDE